MSVERSLGRMSGHSMVERFLAKQKRQNRASPIDVVDDVVENDCGARPAVVANSTWGSAGSEIPWTIHSSEPI